jgi:hypothetical protein
MLSPSHYYCKSLPFSISPCISPSIPSYIPLYIASSIPLSIPPSIPPPIPPSILPTYSSLYPFFYSSLNTSLYLSLYHSLYPSLYLSLFPYLYTFRYPSLYRFLYPSLYYECKFREFSKNLKKTWEILNELMVGNSGPKTISKIKANGMVIDKPKAIANEFNNFFASAGQNVSESVLPIDVPPESFIPILETPVFDLGNTGPIHLSDILKSFPNKSSLDADGISLKILKFVAIEISSPLAHIFNLSLDNGIFPARLKIAEQFQFLKVVTRRSVTTIALSRSLLPFRKYLKKWLLQTDLSLTNK